MDYSYLYNNAKLLNGLRPCDMAETDEPRTVDSDGYQAGDSDETEKTHGACCDSCAKDLPCEVSCPANPTNVQTHDPPDTRGEYAPDDSNTVIP